MIIDLKYNYSMLLDKIKNHYKLKYADIKAEQIMTLFCRDIKIQPYRLKKIFQNRAYFLNNEISKIIKLLNINKKNIYEYFFNEINVDNMGGE